MMISKVPLNKGGSRGMFIRSMKKSMDTPLAEGTQMGNSLRQPAGDFKLSEWNKL